MNMDLQFDVILVNQKKLNKDETIYVCGPMRGRLLNNFPNFFRVCNTLRELGYKVYNPAEYDIARGFCPSQSYISTPENDIQMIEVIKYDLKILNKCGVLIALPGFSVSDGSIIEIEAATDQGIPIIYCGTRVDSYANGCYNVLSIGGAHAGDEHA